MKLGRFIGGPSRSWDGLCKRRGKGECREYTAVATGSMRKRVRAQGIEAPRGACEGGGLAQMCRDTPLPRFSVSADSKGVTEGVSVSADSKGLICTKIVQNARCHGSAESKGVKGAAWWRVCSA